ncbi:PREDICTED: uncharacterized protein LOC109126332 [Camelina sativa]|uniref:Uncharacterized protein LOC109126332 n=1 Tax=Camelina sativa TaxID=90675 RepID=A0ABM1QF42_CAMSA|nr:PREDICTED: uncharacterized protein LOC109126332 [Camelina sativa]
MSSSSGETITVSASQSILSVNMMNMTKLTSTNFLMWSRQVRALLDSYDLIAYVDETVVVPPLTTTTDGVTSDNPDYKIWKRQDRLIYSALLGAISLSVQPLLSNTTTSAEIWCDKLIEAYFQGLTTRFDQLAHLGNPMVHEDQLEKILGGIPEEFGRVVDQLEGRDRTPTLAEVYEKLLYHEVKLKSVVMSSPYLPATANAVNVRGSQSRGQSRGYQHNSRQHNALRSQNSAPRGYQGRCQICGVYGHSARRCSHFQVSGAPFNNNTPTSVPWQPRANMATTTPWLLDSGATHHLTTDLSNLSLQQPYNGGEEVTIADNTGLPISHTGEGSQNGGPVAAREN